MERLNCQNALINYSVWIGVHNGPLVWDLGGLEKLKLKFEKLGKIREVRDVFWIHFWDRLK